MNLYDVIIIGSGPAGLSAGIYAGRSTLKTLLIEKEKAGGQIVITGEIENYPGSEHPESGPSLIKKMEDQATRFNVERAFDEIVEVNLEGTTKVLKGKKGEYHAKAVIIATGAFPRLLGCPGEAEFTGKGVSYCATCDAAFFEDLEVYVVGGGDSAVEESLHLAKFARKVTIIQMMDHLTAAKSYQKKAEANPKIHYMFNSAVQSLHGDEGILDRIVVKNLKTEEITELKADEEDGTFGLFVFIGFIPNAKLFEGKVELDRGYVVADENMKTNVPGVFVAGDVRVKALRQVVTAAADGAIAAVMAEKYIESLED